MIKYLEGNVDFVIDYFRQYIQEIVPVRPQASFLVWLDCRRLGLTHGQLTNLFVNIAQLALNDGEMFGKKEGHGFMRMNVGCPRSMIEKALGQLRGAVDLP